MENKTKNIIISIGFVIILITIFFINLLSPDKIISSTERRKLQQFPEISVNKILTGNSMKTFENYTTDQFIGRDYFRNIKSIFNTYIFRQKDDNNLFEKDEYVNKTNTSNHLDSEEIEADRYAANKTSEKAIKRAIRNIDKLYNKNSPKDIDKLSSHKIHKIHKINAENKNEIKYRSKALKDPALRKSPIYKESYEDDIVFDPFMEADNMKPEYNTDMSEAEAKRTLKTISQNIINDISKKSSYRVSQYTANIYANIITKNLLPIWATGFRKVTITITDDKSNTLEFKVPKMTQDFVSRFIRGRESINGFIHRNPEINIRISSRVFNTIQNPDDAFNFFKAAIKYYNSGLEKYSEKLMFESMKLNHEMKHLISTTKLSGIVTCPMQLLFVFDDVDMSNKDIFKISQQDIKTVNQFIRNIYTRYAAPEKEKKQIIDDVNEMIRTLKESCDGSDENIRQLTYLPEAVNDYLFGNFESTITDYDERWMTEQFDMDWIHNQKNPQVKYLQEKFGVKKLKKIPADLVAYITIETESIKDANDKMMISSYCLSKLEIVEWYIELLEVGSKKYIVPHTKPYLESVRTQLLACFKRIMEVKIVNPDTKEDVPYGETGEICVSGPTVMLGYLDNEKETNEMLQIHKDGVIWLHTGDMGMMTDEGIIYYRQRIKRMIITSGYNVYPSQLENIIDGHDMVEMSCVIGVKDDYKMQKIKAFVVLKAGIEESEEVKAAGVPYVTLEEMWQQADVISLHAPLTDENFHMIDEKAIAQMKDGVMIVNTARGGLIDSEALIAGIESGKIGGAGLDVVENEFGLYYYDHKSDILNNRELAVLRGFPNVTVSHHMAFYTDECVKTVVRDSLLGCKCFVEGKENPWEVK